MTREHFDPYPGRIYKNNGGGQFICIATGDDTYSAVMKNIESGWTITANGIGIYEDGTIDWDYSTGGYFDSLKDWEQRAKVLNRAVNTFGKNAQVDMMIEEMSELTKALLNERRGRANNIAEEIADVKIVLEQMEIIFQNGEEVNEIIRQKTKRLDKILQDMGE